MQIHQCGFETRERTGINMEPSYAAWRIMNIIFLPRFISASRLIGDVEMKKTQSREKLEEFRTFTNPLHIKFTEQIFETQNIVLDIPSISMDGGISLDLYTSQTNAHQCLTPFSCHPKGTSNGIPRGLTRMIRHIRFNGRIGEIKKR